MLQASPIIPMYFYVHLRNLLAIKAFEILNSVFEPLAFLRTMKENNYSGTCFDCVCI